MAEIFREITEHFQEYLNDPNDPMIVNQVQLGNVKINQKYDIKIRIFSLRLSGNSIF